MCRLVAENRSQGCITNGLSPSQLGDSQEATGRCPLGKEQLPTDDRDR